MNRARMQMRRRQVEHYRSAVTTHNLELLLRLHNHFMGLAKDRIDHHDEKLGIMRPIGSWKPSWLKLKGDTDATD